MWELSKQDMFEKKRRGVQAASFFLFFFNELSLLIKINERSGAHKRRFGWNLVCNQSFFNGMKE
jgi:hypothetical protein